MAGKIAGTLLAILIGFATCDVNAKDRDGNFAVKGVGVLDCQAFIDAAAQVDRELAQYAGYITGYISAVNEVQADTEARLPPPFALQHCNSSCGSSAKRVLFFFWIIFGAVTYFPVTSTFRVFRALPLSTNGLTLLMMAFPLVVGLPFCVVMLPAAIVLQAEPTLHSVLILLTGIGCMSLFWGLAMHLSFRSLVVS